VEVGVVPEQRHCRLIGQQINGGDSDEVRIRILSCQGGAASTRIEGVQGMAAGR
jgi:hypothetical protein